MVAGRVVESSFWNVPGSGSGSGSGSGKPLHAESERSASISAHDLGKADLFQELAWKIQVVNNIKIKLIG